MTLLIALLIMNHMGITGIGSYMSVVFLWIIHIIFHTTKKQVMYGNKNLTGNDYVFCHYSWYRVWMLCYLLVNQNLLWQ